MGMPAKFDWISSELLRGLDEVRTSIKSVYSDYFAVVRGWGLVESY